MRRTEAPTTRAALLACLLVTAAAAASCSTTTPTTPAAILPVPTPTPSDSTLALPLDTYAPTSVELAKQTYVLRRAEQACMRDYGFDYLPNLAPHIALTAQNAHESASRRYGVSDQTIAATRGYHLSAQAAGPAAPASINTLPATQRLALTGAPGGTARTAHGKPIPPGGCLRMATAQIVGPSDNATDTLDLVAKLDHDDHTKAMADPRLKTAITHWSACMTSSRYSYTDPYAALADPRWNLDSATPTHTEIQTALADIACKHSTNLLGIAYAVESDYENTDIARNGPALADAKQELNTEAQRVDQLWAQYSNQPKP